MLSSLRSVLVVIGRHSWSIQLQSPLHQPSDTQVSPSYGHRLQSIAECLPQLTSLLLGDGGSVVADQMARRPVRVTLPSEMNVMSTLFVFVMMVNGVGISPQYFSFSISNQSYEHVLSSSILKWRKVMFTLCSVSTASVHVYTNTNKTEVTSVKLVLFKYV